MGTELALERQILDPGGDCGKGDPVTGLHTRGACSSKQGHFWIGHDSEAARAFVRVSGVPLKGRYVPYATAWPSAGATCIRTTDSQAHREPPSYLCTLHQETNHLLSAGISDNTWKCTEKRGWPMIKWHLLDERSSLLPKRGCRYFSRILREAPGTRMLATPWMPASADAVLLKERDKLISARPGRSGRKRLRGCWTLHAIAIQQASLPAAVDIWCGSRHSFNNLVHGPDHASTMCCIPKFSIGGYR
jgi:hypothetical protein